MASLLSTWATFHFLEDAGPGPVGAGRRSPSGQELPGRRNAVPLGERVAGGAGRVPDGGPVGLLAGAPGRAGPGNAAELGGGAGVGVTSWLHFMLLVSGAASAATVLAAGGALLLLLAVLIWRMRSRGAQPDAAGVNNLPRFRWNWILAVVLATSVSAVALVQCRLTASNPHGGWDGWAIWNLRAKFLAGPGDSWRNALSPELVRTHPDYPLLVSGFIASNWRAAGSKTSPPFRSPPTCSPSRWRRWRVCLRRKRHGPRTRAFCSPRWC